jgi:hypothetical protein
MTSNMLTNLLRSLLHRRARVIPLLAVILVLVVMPMHAQIFSSGSDGSDGPYAPSGPSGTVIIFDPTPFHGSQVAANIFNFTTITIPTGVTVKLSGNTLTGPIFWLASGDVNIEGTVDLSGGQGYGATSNPFLRVTSVPGSGGYAGGVGGNNVQLPQPGNGPGGGISGNNAANGNGGPGTFSGNQFLIPLVGGSGGGGAWTNQGTIGGFPDGGGAGGGALLIAGSTQIIVNGTINANGGASGTVNHAAGGGSGGAIRLVSNTITGSGSGVLEAIGGTATNSPGLQGVVRLEATTISFAGGVSATLAESTPFPLLLPTAGPASAKVISINGTPITPNPSTFPDITINTTSLVDVVIQTQNIPTTAVLTLTILDENGVADTVVQAPPLGSCNSSNVCTTTAQVMFPFGASRGLTRVTWTQ